MQGLEILGLSRGLRHLVAPFTMLEVSGIEVIIGSELENLELEGSRVGGFRVWGAACLRVSVLRCWNKT